jgi:hypothetical protein
VTIHSSGQTVFSFPHIESITLGASEEVDQVVEGGMGVNRTGEVGDRGSATIPVTSPTSLLISSHLCLCLLWLSSPPSNLFAP